MQATIHFIIGNGNDEYIWQIEAGLCEEAMHSQISTCDEEGQAENSWQGGHQQRDNQAQGKEDLRESPESGQRNDVMSGRRQQEESGKYSVRFLSDSSPIIGYACH